MWKPYKSVGGWGLSRSGSSDKETAVAVKKNQSSSDKQTAVVVTKNQNLTSIVMFMRESADIA